MNIFHQILYEAYCVYALMESEIKNGDQQTEALEIDFVIDLEMCRNWQKWKFPRFRSLIIKRVNVLKGFLFHFCMQHSDYYLFTN